jgi:D-alanyl-D-alanine carboxypeptidase.
MAYDRDAWRAEVENGKVPRYKLEAIIPGQYDPDLEGPGIMHPEAAAAMSALLEAAHHTGITELHTKYTYRTIAKQWEKWADFQSGGNLAAYPGTSNHGWAVAVDFTGLTDRALGWLRNNSQRFGYVNDVPTENWHYTYYGGWVPEQEDEMTPEERERLKDVEAWQSGYDEAIAGKPQPPQGAKPARKRGYKAGTKALTNPKTSG